MKKFTQALYVTLYVFACTFMVIAQTKTVVNTDSPLVTQAPHNKGVWSSTTTYILNDLVSINGGTYLSLSASNLNHQPPNSAYWQPQGAPVNADGSITVGGAGTKAGSVQIPLNSGTLPTTPPANTVIITNQANHPTALYPDGTTKQLDASGSGTVSNASGTSTTAPAVYGSTSPGTTANPLTAYQVAKAAKLPPIYADTLPTSCTDGNGNNWSDIPNVAIHCYAEPAIAASIATGIKGVDVVFSATTYYVNADIQFTQDAQRLPNLIGVPGGTVFYPTNTSTAPVISNVTHFQLPQFFHMAGITINVNGAARPCAHIFGIVGVVGEDNTCFFPGNNAPYAFRWGEPTGGVSGDSQEFFLRHNLIAGQNKPTASALFNAPVLSGGSLVSVTSSNGGGLGYLNGNSNVNFSVTGCTTPPTSVTYTVSGGQIQSPITFSGSSGCGSDPSKVFINANNYVPLGGAAEQFYISDSVVRDEYQNGFKVCMEAFYPNTTFDGLHPTECGTGFKDSVSGGTIALQNIEFDTINWRYIDYESASPLTISGSHGVSLSADRMQGVTPLYLGGTGQVTATGNLGFFTTVPTGCASIRTPSGTLTKTAGVISNGYSPLTYLGNDDSCDGIGNILTQQTTFTGGVTGAGSGGSSYANYGAIVSFGDSLTQGTGATTGMNKGVTATSYAALLGNDFVQALDYGFGGDQAADLLGKVINTVNPTKTRNPIVTMMIGVNDANVYGTDTNKQDTYSRSLGAAIAWAAIPDTAKAFVKNTSVCTRSGTWNLDGSNIYSTSTGAYLTCTVTTTGAGLSVVVQAADGYGGTGSITVDGSAPTGDTTSLLSSGAGGTNILTNNGTTVTNKLYNYTSVTAGTHTVVLTSTNSSVFYPLWMGTTNTAGVNDLAPPVVFVGGVTPNETGNSAPTATYDSLAKAIVAKLAGEGYPVYFVDIRNGTNTANSTTFAAINNTTDYDGGTLANGYACPASTLNPYHPGNCGHKKLATAFEAAIGVKQDGPILHSGVMGMELANGGFAGSPATLLTLDGDLRATFWAGMSYGYSSDTTLHLGAPGGITNVGPQRLAATTAATCSAAISGQIQYTAGVSGSKDVVQVCAKDASNTYAWRAIY